MTESRSWTVLLIVLCGLISLFYIEPCTSVSFQPSSQSITYGTLSITINSSFEFQDSLSHLVVKPILNLDKYLISNDSFLCVNIESSLKHASDWQPGTENYFRLEWKNDTQSWWNEIQNPIAKMENLYTFHLPPMQADTFEGYTDYNISLRVRVYKFESGMEQLLSSQPEIMMMDNIQRVLRKTDAPIVEYWDNSRSWITLLNRPTHSDSWILYSFHDATIFSPNALPSTYPITQNETLACFSYDRTCLISRPSYILPIAKTLSTLYIRQIQEGKYWSDISIFNLTTDVDGSKKYFKNETFWKEVMKRKVHEIVRIDSDDQLLGLTHIPVTIQIFLLSSFLLGVIIGCCGSWNLVEEFYNVFIIETLKMLPKSKRRKKGFHLVRQRS